MAFAVAGGFVDVSTVLLKNGANVNEKLQEFPLVSVAALEGDLEMIKLLIGKGANINAVNEETGESSLYFACEADQGPIVDYLLANGADAHLANKKGVTPMMISVQKGHVDIINRLSDGNVAAFATSNE